MRIENEASGGCKHHLVEGIEDGCWPSALQYVVEGVIETSGPDQQTEEIRANVMKRTVPSDGKGLETVMII